MKIQSNLYLQKRKERENGRSNEHREVVGVDGDVGGGGGLLCADCYINSR